MSRQCYSAIETDAALAAWSRQYLLETAHEYNLDIPLDDLLHNVLVVHGEPDYASCVLSFSPPDAKIGDPVDWRSIRYHYDVPAPLNDPSQVVLILVREAFEGYSKQEWKKVLRHELAHIVQHYRYGLTTENNKAFHKLLDTLDTAVTTRPFA